MTAEKPSEWTFRSTVIDPGGVRVTTVITVPVAATWGDVRECGELSQMGAHFTANHVSKSRARSLEEEPPF